jgi:Zn-dependent alcohol dehydrogenase
MTRRIRAAVLERPGGGLTIEELDLADPARDEVLVRIDAAGVCHSDYHYLTGDLPSRMPVVPGHEGAGEVVAVGAEVTAVRPGDMVGLMWRPRCGKCRYCLTGRPALCQSGAIHAASGGLQDGTTRLSRPDGTAVHHLMGVSCFAEYAIVSERAVVPIPPGVPADIAAITGCAVITGVGTVLNAIGPCAGQGLVVFGAGGVGLSVVMGAVLAGAYPIVAVDMVAERLEAATRLGATHVVNAGSEDVAAALADIDADGLDYAVEAIGRPATLRQAFDALRRRHAGGHRPRHGRSGAEPAVESAGAAGTPGDRQPVRIVQPSTGRTEAAVAVPGRAPTHRPARRSALSAGSDRRRGERPDRRRGRPRHHRPGLTSGSVMDRCRCAAARMR